MKAIFWDNDGVLVDTEHLYFEATRSALATLGVTLTEALFLDVSLARGRSCFDLASARGVSEGAILSARAERDRIYGASLARVELIAGVREALAALHGRVPMAVVTSSQPENFARQHANTGALGFFEFVLTGADYTRSKPEPEPYLLAASRLGVAPADCLVVEDSERGLVAATRAGMRCAVIPRGLAAAGNFAGAWRVLAEVAQVPPLLAAW
jgi:HAD superfamily hydrolase (TIGR01509 family)